jgi:hypothetical protein
MRMASRLKKMELERRSRPCQRCHERGGRVWYFSPGEAIPANFSRCRGCGRDATVKVVIMENSEQSEWREGQPCG